MRASRVNEHKLVLQDYFNSADGVTLFSATAAALEMTPDGLRATIASLPRLDFYLPFKIHRLSWKPTSDVYVAATYDLDPSSVAAYGTNGQVVTLQKADGVPKIPVIVLHPAEPKAFRDAPQPDTPGDVIEDPTDGDLASTFIPPEESDLSLGNSLSSAFTVLPPDSGGGGGGGGGTPAPGTYINHFNIQANDGYLGGAQEMRFKSWAVVGYQGFVGAGYLVSDTTCDKGTYARDGVDGYVGYEGLFSISPTVTAGSYLTCGGRAAIYGIQIWEIDGDIGSDDDYGWRFWTSGNYPLGALYDPTVNQYFANTTDQSTLTAYLRIEIH